MSKNEYHAFMLRMQRVGDREHPKWIYTLQDANTQIVQRFHSLGALMVFIEQQTEASTAIEHTSKKN